MAALLGSGLGLRHSTFAGQRLQQSASLQPVRAVDDCLRAICAVAGGVADKVWVCLPAEHTASALADLCRHHWAWQEVGARAAYSKWQAQDGANARPERRHCAGHCWKRQGQGRQGQEGVSLHSG